MQAGAGTRGQDEHFGLLAIVKPAVKTTNQKLAFQGFILLNEETIHPSADYSYHQLW
jgi:hypothetical protein